MTKNRLVNYINKKGGVFSKGNFDLTFLITAVIAAVVGLLTLYSATYVIAYTEKDYHGDTEYFLKRQLLFLIIGLVIMTVISMLNYRLLNGWLTVFAVIGTLGLMLLPRTQEPYHNTYRNFHVGTLFQFQPSDVGKFALILGLACFLSKYANDIRSDQKITNGLVGKLNGSVGKLFGSPITKSWMTAIGAALIIGAFEGMLLVEHHLSCMLIMAIIGIGMLYVSGFKKRWFVIGIVLITVAFVVLVQLNVFQGFQIERITTFFNRENADVTNERWQTTQGLYAIASGGVFGKGIGRSVAKQMYVPEPQNDMIFAIFIEELGLLGAAGVLVLFAVMIWRGTVIALRAKDRFGMLTAMGITIHIATQVIMNIAVVTDIMPNTGVPFPFFSQGGTAIIMLMVEVGMMLSISKNGRVKRGS